VRTGDLAAAAGVHPETLRYYERRGLLTAPVRSLGGQRDYPASALATLRAIKLAQRLGFTLDEVASLLSPSASGLRSRADAKLAEIETRIAGLQTAATSLRSAVAAGCDDLSACAAEPDCPALSIQP
jgi:MerR family mercuric resistance operon transcriptional regulator